MPVFQLNYRDSRPIYSQIIANFHSQISSGVLRSGDKLPSVRELAAQLAINPNTIQRAYRELEAAGWIASVSGKGSFVCGVPSTGNAPLSEFDRLVAELLRQGVSKEELMDHVQQGGNYHAENAANTQKL